MGRSITTSMQMVFTVKEANEKRIEMVEVEWKEGGRTPPARVA